MKSIFKKFTAVLAFILTLIIAFTMSACAANKADSAAPGGASSPGGGGYFDSELSGSEGADSPDALPDDGTPPEGSGSGNQQKPIVKQLTAAEWRDAYNYDFWLGLFEQDVPFEGQDGGQYTRNGIFSAFATATRGLNTSNMHEVSVTCDEAPVVGANVSLYDESELIYSAVTDSAGVAYVFGNGTRIEAVSGGYSASAEVSEGVIELSLSNCTVSEDELEIMFVVDTTGSMGDELSFLCDELAGIIERVSNALLCKIRLGLVFYRDTHDQYLTRSFSFAEVNSQSGLADAIDNIKAQSSAGGGDYPEAVDAALKKAVEADWHDNSKTKLLFHVLDAPYHDKQENQTVFANAVSSAAEKGIRIIPVAASGLDTLGQYIMRSAALLTGGTYTFLTDDSGIGDHHELPAVGKFTVEYLSDLMVRLIKGYYTGVFEEPILWSQSESVV